MCGVSVLAQLPSHARVPVPAGRAGGGAGGADAGGAGGAGAGGAGGGLEDSDFEVGPPDARTAHRVARERMRRALEDSQ